MAWIRCSGLHLHAWDQASFLSIVAEVGKLVLVDENTTNLKTLECTRLLVHLSSPQPVMLSSSIKINNTIYNYMLIEENFTTTNNCNCPMWNYKNSTHDPSLLESILDLQEEVEDRQCLNNLDHDHYRTIVTVKQATATTQHPDKLLVRENELAQPQRSWIVNHKQS